MSRGKREKENGGNLTSTNYCNSASGWLVKRGDARQESAKCKTVRKSSAQRTLLRQNRPAPCNADFCAALKIADLRCVFQRSS